MQNKIGTQILGYFLKGLLYTVPLAVLGYIVYQVFIWLDSLIPLEKKFPGLGILLLLAIVTTIGFLGSTLIGKPIRKRFNELLERVPLIKTIYTSINKLMSAFVGQKKRFDKPVLVKVNKTSNLEKLGFITDEDLTIIGKQEGKVAVYMPHSFNFSGNLFIVASENVTAIEQKGADVMKYIVSGGIADLNDDEQES